MTNESSWHVINSGYVATPASTSTITTTQSFGALLLPGSALRYTLAGNVYRGIVTNVAAALITIAGVPLSSDIQKLEWADSSSVIIRHYYLKELYNAVGGNAMLAAEYFWIGGDLWLNKTAYVVRIAHNHSTDDTAGVIKNPNVNIMIDGNPVCSANTNTGRKVATANTVVYTDVDLITANLRLVPGSRIEVAVTPEAADNGDANGLQVWLTLVLS